MKSAKIEDKKLQEKISKAYRPFRGLLQAVLENQPGIKIESLQKSGYIKFKVKCKDVNLDPTSRKKYENEIYTYFFANFLGELLVRENLEQFAHILSNCDMETFKSGIIGTSHENFGVDIYRGSLIFTFHINLVQELMFENLKDAVNNNERRRK